MKEYKRVTVFTKNNKWGIDGKLVNQWKPKEEIFADAFEIVVNRLAKLEDKIENETLVELPCNVGDKIYFETWEDNGNTSIGIKGHKVAGFEINAIINGKYGKTYIPIKAVGIDVFLTKAEAEKKLKEIQNER